VGADAEFIQKVIGDLQTRSRTLVEMAASADFYFAENLQYEPEAAQKFLQPEAAAYLKEVAARIPAWGNFTKEGIEEFLKAYAQEKEIKLKVIAQPLRVALTGKTVSPGIDEVMVTLGKDIVIKRIHAAADWIVANN
jgi:glutamyl-tRNA synthetase